MVRKVTIPAMARKPEHRCCSVPNFGEVSNTLENQLRFMPAICVLYARWSPQVSKYCRNTLIITVGLVGSDD